MLSRVANSLYWLSRYLERAENLARLVEVNRYDSLDSSVFANDNSGSENIWQPLLYATCLENSYSTAAESDPSLDVVWFITFSKDNTDSIRQCVAHARENARMVRDQISEEIWRELNRFHLFIGSEKALLLWQDRPELLYRKIIESCLLLSGLINATILHDEGWHFMQVGKYLERADKTTRVLDMLAFQGQPHRTKLGSALKSCSAFNAFNAEYRSSITLDNTMRFLLFSQSFPRSVRFCLAQLDTHLHAISGTAVGTYDNEAERLTGSSLAQLNFSSIENVLQAGYHPYIDSLQSQFNDIGQQVFETYILLPLEIRSLRPSELQTLQRQQQQQ
ncbi:MAG: alpha-E domain-containing protein [Coraliomargarita sp.]